MMAPSVRASGLRQGPERVSRIQRGSLEPPLATVSPRGPGPMARSLAGEPLGAATHRRMAHSHLRFASRFALLLLAPAASAGTLFVDAGLASGLNDGSSWANAYQGPDGLQAALGAAVAGDQVFAREGSYRTTSGSGRGASFLMVSGVEIYGSFLGGEATPAERPPFGSAPSVLDGDLAGDDGSGLFGDNSYHLVKAGTADASAILDGFVIRGGNSNGSGNADTGGGILCLNGSSPTVRNCDFVANRCTFGGGAGYINSANPSFTNCRFIDNVGGSFGGAFDIATGGAVVFERCTFLGNRAARAGALEIFATSGVRISNSLFSGNTATGGSGGGAIWCGSGGATQVINCTLIANNAPSNEGGGIRMQNSSTVAVSNSILWGNTGSGGAHAAANQLTLGQVATYSIVEGGYAGAGNLASDPQLDANLRPTLGSPGIDAGNNSLVPAGLVLDVDGQPRFVDVASVADTGVGSAPIVDMGSHEYGDLTFTAFCFGDGSGTACPCANAGGPTDGCANSSAAGGLLEASGSANVGADDLQLIGSNLLPSQPALLFVGNVQISSGAGVVFGDGLRCVGGTVVRLGVAVPNVFGVASWGPGLSAAGGWQPGDSRSFQVWYRDPAGPCGSAFNLSNGLAVLFQ